MCNLQRGSEKLYNRLERPLFPSLNFGITRITPNGESVTAAFPMDSLIPSLVLPISQQLVCLCLCLRRKLLVDIARVDQDLSLGSTRDQAFEVDGGLETRGVGHCACCNLSLDGQLEDVLRSKAITRRSEGGNALFFKCFEDSPQGSPGFVVWVLGEPGLHVELDTTQILLAAREYPEKMCVRPLEGSPELGRYRKRLAHTSDGVLAGLLQAGMYETNLEAVLRKSVGQKLHPDR